MSKEYIRTSTRGDTSYYKDPQKTILHRLDGPAVEYAGGSKAWWLNGVLHRVDGPAVEWANGDKEWFVNGVFMFETDSNGNILHRMR